MIEEDKGNTVVFRGCHIRRMGYYDFLEDHFELFDKEICCGFEHHRHGREKGLEIIKKRIINLFSKYSDRTILVLCPHCYYFLKNEYKFKNVFYIFQYLENLPESAGVYMSALSYFDPCYLTRYESMFNLPRFLLKKHVRGVYIISEREGLSSPCCGHPISRKYPELASEISKTTLLQYTAVDHLLTSCPRCMKFLNDNVKDAGLEIKIHDLTKVILEGI